MVLRRSLLLLFVAHSYVEGGPLKDLAPHSELRPEDKASSAESGRLRGGAAERVSNTTALHAVGTGAKGMPCQCVAGMPTWLPSRRTVPKCVFIDLGAADGNTFKDFKNGVYGPVQNCPSGGQWEATLVEANPRFEVPLKNLQVSYPGKVHAANSHAAYMCEAQTTFYLDT